MRIISGIARGRRLFSPKGLLTRPVSDRVKGSLFNILGNISGEDVLDIFAGSGALGVEALSRGANFCAFIESSRLVCESIRKNVAMCGFAERSEILPLDFARALKVLSKRGKKFDIIFIDPPYFLGLIPRALGLISELDILKKDGLILAEHNKKEEVAEKDFALTDRREYGQTAVSFFKKSLKCHSACPASGEEAGEQSEESNIKKSDPSFSARG